MSIILTVIASVFIFGLIIFIHELGHFLAARAGGIQVNEFAIGMGPTLIKWQRKGTVFALRLFPIGGFCSMEGEDEESDQVGSFQKAPVGSRILVIVAGAMMNLLLGLIVVIGLVASESLVPTRTIHSFREDAVTEASGLRVNDTIVSMNGRNMFVANDILYEMARLQGAAADVTVLRDGERVTLEDVAFDVRVEDGVSRFNLDFTLYGVEKTVGNVLREAGLWTLSITRLVFVSLVDLITGHVAINQMSGPVGIIDVIGQAVAVDFYQVFYILAIITVNLGAMNLLPLPALDGGRLVILLIEAVTRKRMNPKYEGYIHAAGFALLIGLMLFVTYNDVSKLFRGGAG